MTQTESAGLYIHIPFCRRQCLYCDFYSVEDLERIPAFVEGLAAEMALYRSVGFRFDTLYFGGGTPSLLTPDQVARILETAHKTFDLSPDAEITLEANPGTATPDTLAGYRSAGVNRLNIGVQSFRDQHLKFLGRIHSAASAEAAIRAAREAGFDNLGLDLIYGLPGMSPEGWKADLERAADFGPAHLSCYLLTWEEGTPLHRSWREGRRRPPADALCADLFQLTGDVLADRGFIRYEVSNFARSASLQSRHNQKYWSLAPYLGLGPAAHSFDPLRSVRRWNHRRLERYLADLSAGRPPVADRETLDEEQRMMEIIYLGLRTAAGIDHLDFERRFGAEAGLRLERASEPLAAEGLLEPTPRRRRPTRRGMRYADGMAARICSRF